MIRYSHYALSCIGSPPYFITYLRFDSLSENNASSYSGESILLGNLLGFKFLFLPVRYTAFILLYPVGLGPGESKLTSLLKLMHRIHIVVYHFICLWSPLSSLCKSEKFGLHFNAVWLMYQALPFIKRKNLYADSLPFSYCNFVKVRSDVLKQRSTFAETCMQWSILFSSIQKETER